MNSNDLKIDKGSFMLKTIRYLWPFIGDLLLLGKAGEG